MANITLWWPMVLFLGDEYDWLIVRLSSGIITGSWIRLAMSSVAELGNRRALSCFMQLDSNISAAQTKPCQNWSYRVSMGLRSFLIHLIYVHRFQISIHHLSVYMPLLPRSSISPGIRNDSIKESRGGIYPASSLLQFVVLWLSALGQFNTCASNVKGFS